jgi:hypothetical protein
MLFQCTPLDAFAMCGAGNRACGLTSQATIVEHATPMRVELECAVSPLHPHHAHQLLVVGRGCYKLDQQRTLYCGERTRPAGSICRRRS